MLIINVEMSTIAGISTFISRINTTNECFTLSKAKQIGILF